MMYFMERTVSHCGFCTLLNMYYAKDRHGASEILIIPTLPEAFSRHHRFHDEDRKREATDGEHELHLVEVLAEDIERVRRCDARGEQVQAVCEHERCGLEQRRGCRDAARLCHLHMHEGEDVSRAQGSEQKLTW